MAFSLPFSLPFQKDPERERLCAELSLSLRSAAASRASAAGARGELRGRVRAHQSARLKATHADLLADGRFGAAAAFFLNEIYAERAPAWRDEQMLRALPTLSRFLPAVALRPVALAMRLDSVTESLDERLASALSPEEPLTPEAYARAYKSVERRARAEQLDLVAKVCEGLAAASRLPLVPQALGAMRGPARALGLSELQSFLERGFAAFKSLERPEAFVAALLEKERAISEALYAEPSEPESSN